MKVAFIFPPPWDPYFPPYTMALFKASTRKTGHDFIDFDMNVDLFKTLGKNNDKLWEPQNAYLWDVDHEEILRTYKKYFDSCVHKLIEKHIDLYTMSINCYSKHAALYVAERIKQIEPQASILMGGPQCFPAYDGINILSNNCVDAICTGEGDTVWPIVLHHFEQRRSLEIDIPGIAYRNKSNGTIIYNGIPELVRDLNVIPFADFTDVDYQKYGSRYQFSIMTSRGCINTCAFCSERPNFQRYRFRRAENIFDEIEYNLINFRNNASASPDNKITPYISFNDSLINGVPRELEKLCDHIINSGYKFSWGGMALIRNEMTFDLLSKMKRAGCYNLAWGLESGCQDVLTLMNKKFFDMNLAKKVIERTHEIGINQSISLIVGFPGETEKMFLQTKEFVEAYKDYFTVGVQPMMISKNSPVYNNYKEFGVACVEDWLKWQTVDGSNNYDIRLGRVNALQSILNSNIKTIHKEKQSQVSKQHLHFFSIDRIKFWREYLSRRLSYQTKQRLRNTLSLFGIRI